MAPNTYLSIQRNCTDATLSYTYSRFATLPNIEHSSILCHRHINKSVQTLFTYLVHSTTLEFDICKNILHTDTTSIAAVYFYICIIPILVCHSGYTRTRLLAHAGNCDKDKVIHACSKELLTTCTVKLRFN